MWVKTVLVTFSASILIYLVGVDCFGEGYVYYSASSELTVLVTFIILPLRS